MTLNKLTANGQIALTIVFTAGYFTTLSLFVLGYVRTPPTWKDTLASLLSLLTAGQLLILQFWFSRSRGSELPPSGAGGGE